MSNTKSGRVEGLISIVTGAGGAIGRAICLKLAKEGSKVSCIDVDEASVKETASLINNLGGTSSFAVVDVTKEKAVKEHIEKVVSDWGKLDILVNNAAAFVFGTVEEATEDDWDKVLSVNVKGYAFLTKHAIPHMKKIQKGSIVNIASISSFVAQPSFVPYNTSKGSLFLCKINKKGAILQLTRCTAMDHGVDNIRVNAICPGTIDTPATSKHAAKLGVTKDELTKDLVKDHFLKKLGTVEDVANAVLFLASDESSFITGSTLMIDGGYTAH